MEIIRFQPFLLEQSVAVDRPICIKMAKVEVPGPLQIQKQIQTQIGGRVPVVGINIVKVEDRALLRPLKWKIQRTAALPAPASDQGGGADHTTVDFQRCSSDRATSLVQGLQPPAKLLRSCLSNSFRRALSIIFTHFHKLSGSGISTNTCCHSCALRQAANK